MSDLLAPLMPAAHGLRLAIDAMPPGTYRSVSASAEIFGELITVTFSAGIPAEEAGEDHPSNPDGA
jgi:hypothetical protein